MSEWCWSISFVENENPGKERNASSKSSPPVLSPKGVKTKERNASSTPVLSPKGVKTLSSSSAEEWQKIYAEEWQDLLRRGVRQLPVCISEHGIEKQSSSSCSSSTSSPTSKVSSTRSARLARARKIENREPNVEDSNALNVSNVSNDGTPNHFSALEATPAKETITLSTPLKSIVSKETKQTKYNLQGQSKKPTTRPSRVLKLKLSREQVEAVNHPGPLFLFGRSGTAKTTILEYRTRRMIMENDINALVLFITASPRLARGARERFLSELQNSSSGDSSLRKKSIGSIIGWSIMRIVFISMSV